MSEAKTIRNPGKTKKDLASGAKARNAAKKTARRNWSRKNERIFPQLYM